MTACPCVFSLQQHLVQHSAMQCTACCIGTGLDFSLITSPVLKHLPLQTDGHLLRLTYTLRTPRGPGGSLITYQGEQPTRLLGKLCYSTYVSTDRAWRGKNKPYPRVSWQPACETTLMCTCS
jgi:hypothetical protein